jgi:hypothetical protein
VYGIPSIFLFHGSERNSEIFAFRGTGGIPLEETNFSASSIFRGIFFLSEIANPNQIPSEFPYIWGKFFILIYQLE